MIGLGLPKGLVVLGCEGSEGFCMVRVFASQGFGCRVGFVLVLVVCHYESDQIWSIMCTLISVLAGSLTNYSVLPLTFYDLFKFSA